MKLDILAIGVHPDDVELSCAGVLIMEQMNGKLTGILDLTKGELGTRGTAATRKKEAADAAKVMGVAVRENLGLADGFFENNKESQLKIIRVIRKYQPDVVFANSLDDRHPDHGRAAKLVEDACFLSGLRKIKTKDGGREQTPWKPSYIFHYLQDYYHKPDILIDISDAIEKKIEAIRCYKTQFYTKGFKNNEPQTYISSPEFMNFIVSRTEAFGKHIGVRHAEGFVSRKMIGLKNLESIIKKTT
ncbi:MAG: bacillithiol biosynthesis deacetylase BshB1 [Chitinophagaceae bacterium]|nr:bacillithiol biosynthesis deacetylase BshB1 [Chitinophagaceae bacterium]MCZ2397361.1 bacillithiol biosynthesis deacetylase BshB1 [Chitinophagales bacterium]